MAALFGLLRERAINPVVIDCLPLAAAREVHTRIDRGGLGGKIVLLPWAGTWLSQIDALRSQVAELQVGTHLPFAALQRFRPLSEGLPPFTAE